MLHCGNCGWNARRAQPLGRGTIGNQRVWINDDAIELRRRFDRHVSLAYVVLHLLDGALERIAIAPTPTAANEKRIVGLECRDQHLGVREIGLPSAALAQRHLVAGACEATVEPPGPAMGALDLGVHGHWNARTHHPLDAEPTTTAAGTTRVRNERVALDHQRKLRLGLLVRRVVSIAIVDAHGGADAILAALGAPAATERAEIGDEEL